MLLGGTWSFKPGQRGSIPLRGTIAPPPADLESGLRNRKIVFDSLRGHHYTRVMKRCGRCKREFPEGEFYWKNKAKGQRQSACRECCNERSAAHYAANPEPYRKRTREHGPSRKMTVQAFIQSQKLACADCGIDHPAVLEFHHLDPTTKERSVGNTHGINQIIREMQKCVVVCSNCHLIRHWNDMSGPFRHRELTTARAATAGLTSNQAARG